MWISASQLSTAQLCIRKWWFERIAKMPSLKGGYLAFGTCLHAVAERYLAGESELFPEGWDFDEESQQTLTPDEAQLIFALVEKGIDEGILERRPGGRIEEKFEFDVVDSVRITGFIDYQTKDHVEDHKTSKNRRYLKSAKKLLEDIQMNVYGKFKLLEHQEQGLTPPRIITYRHNQFIKDPDDPVVLKTEAETTPHAIESFWRDTILPLTDKMLAAKTVDNPFDLEEPPIASCKAYGGCPFTSLCSGGEDMLTFKKRISNMQKRSADRENAMSVTDFLKSRRAAAAALPAAGKPAVNPTPEPEVETSQPSIEADGDQVPPPWYDPECQTCKSKTINRGFNRETGKPCRICMLKSKQSAAGIVYTMQTDGRIVWHKEGEKVAERPAPKVEVQEARKVFTIDEAVNRLETASLQDLNEILQESRGMEEGDRLAVLEVARERRKELEAVVAEAQAAEPEPEPEAPPVEEPKKRRKKKDVEPPASADTTPITSSPEERAEGPSVGLIVLVGCGMNKPFPGRDVVGVEELLAKTEGYYANTNVFDRRDSLRRQMLENAEEYAAAFAKTVVTCSISDPDTNAFVSTLAALPNTLVIHVAR